MIAFKTKEELIKAYTEKYHKADTGFDYIAKSVCKYTPHVYNGGWFIKDFGYSVERFKLGIITVNKLF